MNITASYNYLSIIDPRPYLAFVRTCASICAMCVMLRAHSERSAHVNIYRRMRGTPDRQSDSHVTERGIKRWRCAGRYYTHRKLL